jgi:hypothetical protein
MFRIVALDVCVAIEAKRNAIFKSIQPSLGLRNDMMTFDLRSLKLVAKATTPLARDHRVVSNFLREWHNN